MLYATPIETEEAFYRAFSHCDLVAMMQLWLDGEYVECIHPAGPRVQGITAIRDSWQQIFAEGEKLQIQLIRHHCTQTGNLAVHSVSEQIQLPGANATRAVVLATNIYELTKEGWRMILHHASPARAIKQTSNATMH